METTGEPVRGAGAGGSTSGKEGEAGGEAGPNTDVASQDPRREPAGDHGQALLPTPAPAPAPGDAGKGSSTADDESLVPGRGRQRVASVADEVQE
ncbi:hypothetical protein J3459_002549 [Metarhizium acridum]|nr:hypothetical protein J3459_002549 [Metarhizium acridum]